MSEVLVAAESPLSSSRIEVECTEGIRNLTPETWNSNYGTSKDSEDAIKKLEDYLDSPDML